MRPRVVIKTRSLPRNWLIGRVKPAALKAVSSALPAVRALVVDSLSREADRTLTTMAQVYKAAVEADDAVTMDGGNVVVTLKDPVARALESGFNAYSIKAKMLAKAKKHDRKGRPYIDVVFTHDPKTLPSSIKRSLQSASQLRQRTEGREFVRELRYGSKVVRQDVKHKQGIHDDMKRVRGPAGNRRYKTIRRISNNSSPFAWMHPGFTGVNGFAKIKKTLQPQLRAVVTDALRSAGFKVRP